MTNATLISPIYFFASLGIMFWIGHWRGRKDGRAKV